MKSISRSRLQFLVAFGILALSFQAVFAAGSDFIEDIPDLMQDPDRAGAMIWEKHGFDRSKYTRVMIEPITIFISPDSKYKGMNANDLKALAFGFHESFTNALEPEVAVINTKGEGVLYVRSAITNVKLAKKKRGLLGYTPVGFIATAAADAAGKRISLKDAVLEIEVLDSVSGERLGVLIDQEPKITEADKLSWDEINKTFTFYAERYKERMHSLGDKPK